MRVALVHDYLTQYGGAERVLEVLHEHFEDATVYTSIFDPDQFPPSFREWDVRLSPLAHLPGATVSHRMWTPFYPAVFGHIGRSMIRDADVIIADTSAWSHHVRPADDTPVIAYCHSPARFLYGDPNYLGATRIPGFAKPFVNAVFGTMRRLDRNAAQHLTRVVANSNAVKERIAEHWGVDATVIHPPVDVERFRPKQPVEPEDWYLVVSRLVPHKWIDRAVRACTHSGMPLKVIGGGRAEAELRWMAGPSVEFLGELPDEEVVDHMQRCRALVLPGIEDFGMTAVEAQAAGRPVIAARGGGALETVIDGKTGFLFDPEDQMDLMSLLILNREWDSEAIQAHAQKFSRETFLSKMDALVDDVLSER